MPKEQSCGFVIVHRADAEDLFLVVQHITGLWGFPKGHVEEGEELLECARRELMEETGISDPLVMPGISFSETYTIDRNGVETEKNNILFLGFAKMTLTRPQEGEILQCKFVTAKEAEELFIYDNTKRILGEALEVMKRIPREPVF